MNFRGALRRNQALLHDEARCAEATPARSGPFSMTRGNETHRRLERR